MNWPDDYLIPGIEPYHQEEAGIIYCADCRDILPKLPKVDFVLTDPPYGFNRFPGDESERFLEIIKDCFDVIPLIEGGWAFVFTGTGFLKDVLNAISLNFKRALWMYKPADCTYPYQGWILKSEVILLFSNGKALPLLERKPYKHDCYIHRKVGMEPGINHPTVKPLAIIKDLASRSPEGGVILDPFLGSGTTAVAAKELGRRFIGIEISPEYCKIAVKRLRQGILNFG